MNLTDASERFIKANMFRECKGTRECSPHHISCKKSNLHRTIVSPITKAITILTLSPTTDIVSAPFNHRTSGRGQPFTRHSSITDSPSFTTLPRGSRTKYGSENSLPTAKLVLGIS